MVTAQAERLKNVKYSHLVSSHYFVPFVVQTSGILGEAADNLIWDLGDSSTRQLENPAAENISCRESQLRSKGRMQQRCWEQQGPVWEPGREKIPFGSDLFTGLLH